MRCNDVIVIYFITRCHIEGVFMPRTHLCGPRRGSLRFYKYFVGGRLRFLLRKVAEGSRFDCGQYGSFAVFAVYLQFPVVVCDWLQNHKEQRLEPRKWKRGRPIDVNLTSMKYGKLQISVSRLFSHSVF